MKILIVTYTYPPAKSVNGFRPYHFAKTLQKAGWEVEVLTRHFTGLESVPEDYHHSNNTSFSIERKPEGVVYRTPFLNTWFTYHRINWIQKSGLWRIIYFIQLLFGRTTQESFNHYFKIYLPELLKLNHYDIVLVESGPTNLVRLVSRFALKYNIQYAIDFRDAYYHEMYQDQKQWTWNKRLKIRLEEWHMRKSIRRANRVFSLSEAWLDILKVPNHLREVINNGYDETEWENIETVNSSNHFVISSIGTLYDHSFLEDLLKSVSLFLNKGYENIQVNFIAPGKPEVITKIKKSLPYHSVSIEKDRKTYRESIQSMALSNVLLYHGWSGWRELAGTKIFDYLRSGNRILIVPSDHGILDRIVNQTQSGQTADSPEDAAEILSHWYKEWKNNGNKLTKRDTKNLNSYSRQYQSERLEKSLRALIRV